MHRDVSIYNHQEIMPQLPSRYLISADTIDASCVLVTSFKFIAIQYMTHIDIGYDNRQK